MYLFGVKYHPEAVAELNQLRAFDRARILNAIEKHLTRNPLTTGGRKKRIERAGGDFIHQLRVGDYRVFYDVEDAIRLVVVLHVRRKGQRTTGEIL